MFGCSDGSDVYTLIINLLNELKENAKNFFPVLASDISKPLIDDLNAGKIYLHSRDIEFIEKNGVKELFTRNPEERTREMFGIEFVPYKVNDFLKSKLHALVKDVREASGVEDFAGSVFAFRNGWTFNTLDEQNRIAANFYKNSDTDTLGIIGQSDLFKSNASEFLQRNGFQGIESDIFTRKETDYPSKSIGMPPVRSDYPEFLLFEKRGAV